MTVNHTPLFRAYAKDAQSTYSADPMEAARHFFTENPKKRKCDVLEGYLDGPAFVVAYSAGKMPRSFKGVTKTTLWMVK